MNKINACKISTKILLRRNSSYYEPLTFLYFYNIFSILNIYHVAVAISLIYTALHITPHSVYYTINNQEYTFYPTY